MQPIKISGKLTGQNLPLQTGKAYADLFNVTCQQEVAVETVRSGGAAIELRNMADDTLVELEFEGGFKRWVRAGDLHAQAGQQASRDLTVSAEPMITPASFDVGAKRGALSLVLKFLRVLQVDSVADASNAITSDLIDKLETRQIAEPGVYRCANPDTLELQAVKQAGDIDTSKPVLLFLHGTFSSTNGSFGDLWESRQGYNAPAWLQRLFAPYGQQVFALEHHTLTVSPVQNALQVLRLLPPHTRLHVISHSRGGLVGELLCQGALKRRTRDSGDKFLDSEDVFARDELTAFEVANRASDLKGLQEIEELLRDKQIRVERFVRVACPGRGTVLASERLEDNLSLVFNVLRFIPSPRFQEQAEFVRMVVMAVAHKRTDPQELPGIEAMMPGSPLIRLLNRPNVQLDSDITIIAGDMKASSLLGSFKEWATQRFFGEDNDFVVNTAGMYGGARRLQGMRFYLDQGDDSSHFGYFRKPDIRERLLNALQHPDTDLRLLPLPNAGGTGGAPLRPLTARAAPSATGKSKTKASTIYFLPGFMGSRLLVNGTPVWLDFSALNWGDFTRLQIDSAGIKPEGVLDAPYRPLLDRLDDNHKLVEFTYDWRRSFTDAGRRLGEALERELDNAKEAGNKLVLRLLAHSSGGLVTIAMMSETPGVWKRLREEADCRLVMLGTPLKGTYTAVQILSGQHRLLGLLNMLDGRLDADESKRLADQFARYPGVLELLPAAWLHEERWQQLLGDAFHTWPARSLLADALRVREQLQQVELDAQRLIYLYGKSALTPDDLLERQGEWRFHATGAGDGVTLWTALDAKLPTWFMPVEHGRMASHAEYFQTLQYLLDDGVSRQLEQQPPQIGQASDQWLPVIRNQLFPDEQELLAAALGYHTSLTEEEVRPLVEVRVIHGNLEYVSHPVVVGHYEGDSILSAESVLDKRLGERMSELQRMGLYPGLPGTSHVFLNPGKKPGGAVIVGLGEVGKLTSGVLTASFIRAMMDYALNIREELERNPPADEQMDGDCFPVHVATLLIGTVGGGSVTLADSITAILRAIVQANQALNKSERGIRLRLQVVEFVELYEDRAVEAARLVQDFVQLPEFRSEFTVKSLMQCLPGKRRRVMYNDPPGWWRRIQVEANDSGLKYTTLTDKARAELVLQATQRKLVDQFIDKAITTSADDPETGKILFELLLPAAMKEQAPNAENLVLVLDAAASAYPWELLYNRLDNESQPLSVRFGMVRQLQVGQFRPKVVNPVERAALVVGDPPVGGEFVRLPAAKQEAETVSKLLEAGGFTKVTREIGTDSQSILKALHTGDYRVLHLAGHGVYRYRPDKDSELEVSGMVLGNGIFLTPVEIGQMRKVPELAFINCCHLAQMDFMEADIQNAVRADRSKLAASLAQELIRMGVRAVIAAGWAINDDAAKVFAEQCYNALLQGYTFGQALLMARLETWRQYPNCNTWGAYQCYGDPDYKLLSRQPGSASDGKDTDAWRFVAEVEVVAELQNLVNMADTAQAGDTQWLQERLQQLQRAIPAEWLAHAEIQSALGRAYGKLDMFPQAIEAYTAAQDSPQADYPVLLLEDKASLLTAWALGWSQGKLEAPPKRVAETPAALMEQAWIILQLLDGLGNSLQRFEEVGKYWKRRAMMASGDERAKSLRSMELAYKRAHDFAMQQTHTVAGYPLINWLTCKVVRYLRGEVEQLDRQELKYWLDQARQCADHADKDSASFCSGITRAECGLVHYILGARLNETSQVQRVVGDYELAVGRGAAPRQMRFVSEHLAFLQLMLEERKQDKPQLEPVVMALLEIAEKLVV
ncbi:MAG: CHAT domain-containing protein [Thiothrix sp.]